MKRSLFSIVGCLCLMAPLHAEEKTKPEAREGRPGRGEFFKKLDANQDQSISKEEAGKMWERIGKLDTDGNEILSMDELKAGRPDGEGREGAMRKAGKPGDMAERAERFKKADTDGDGALSESEVPAEAWAKLSKLDQDSDGKVTKSEMAAMGGMAGKGRPGAGGSPANSGAIFDRFDEDKDGKLSKDEVSAEMWSKLSKADADADGRVSRSELESVFAARKQGA